MDYNVETYKLPDAGVDVTVKAADAKAERELWAHRDNLVEYLPRYWADCVIDIGGKSPVTENEILDLRTVDQRFVAIKIVRSTIFKPKIGRAELILTGNCPNCGAAVKYAKDLDTLDFVQCPDIAKLPDPTFAVDLSITGHRVVYGGLTGRQMQDELATPEFDPTEYTWKAIRSVDGVAELSLDTILSWPLGDHKELRDAVMSNKWGYDTRVEFTHQCKPDHTERFVIDLLTEPSFLWPGLPG